MTSCSEARKLKSWLGLNTERTKVDYLPHKAGGKGVQSGIADRQPERALTYDQITMPTRGLTPWKQLGSISYRQSVNTDLRNPKGNTWPGKPACFMSDFIAIPYRLRELTLLSDLDSILTQS